jgi:hypothetical protein
MATETDIKVCFLDEWTTEHKKHPELRFGFIISVLFSLWVKYECQINLWDFILGTQ